MNFRHIAENGDHYQVDYVTQEPQTVAPNGDATLASQLFAGAKIVRLLDRYQSRGLTSRTSTRRWTSAGSTS